MMLGALILASIISFSAGDTPANCMYEDVVGTWTFSETERLGDHTIDCDTLGPVVYVKNITFTYPNKAVDELGNEGTWTIISNQGYEVVINERSYFAFSYYETSSDTVTSYCGKTFNGWSRDTTVRNWSCYKAEKTTEVPPRTTKQLVRKSSTRPFRNDPYLVNKINKLQTSWHAKIYPQFEKYTVEEMQRRGGEVVSHTEAPHVAAPVTPEQKESMSFLPESFDWRDVDGVNYVSPVRDQEQCGSCFAFASMAILEAQVRIATKNQRQDVFSTQDIVECSVLSQGCMGGFVYLIAGRYAQDQGVVAEDCNPYTAKDGSCSTNTTCPRTYVSDYEYVGGYYGACNEAEMMKALVETGPITASFRVYSDFHNYAGGIYHHTELRSHFNPMELTSHVGLVVGYGVDEATGEKYWIAKNSWGADWGEEGFFKIRRGTDECAFESKAMKATIIP